MLKFIITLILGFAFGQVLILSQAYSWFRIQEMFHFDSFHMYGVLFSAIATASLSLFLIKKLNIKSLDGNDVVLEPKKIQWKANIIGGLCFGIGWGLTGACSAPLYILVGLHYKIGISLFVGAMLGTMIYGVLDKKLPK